MSFGDLIPPSLNTSKPLESLSSREIPKLAQQTHYPRGISNTHTTHNFNSTHSFNNTQGFNNNWQNQNPVAKPSG